MNKEDLILKAIDDLKAQLTVCQRDHEDRIRALEAWKAKAIGAIIAAGGLGGLIGKVAGLFGGQ